MNSFFRLFKPLDMVVIFSLIFLSFIPYMIFSHVQAEKSNSNTEYVASISIDNKLVKRINLNDHSGPEIFNITQENDEVNTIEIRNGQIRIKAATCPDQICVKTGFISKNGQTIVCLPNKLVIEIQSTNGEQEDAIISS